MPASVDDANRFHIQSRKDSSDTRPVGSAACGGRARSASTMKDVMIPPFSEADSLAAPSGPHATRTDADDPRAALRTTSVSDPELIVDRLPGVAAVQNDELVARVRPLHDVPDVDIGERRAVEVTLLRPVEDKKKVTVSDYAMTREVEQQVVGGRELRGELGKQLDHRARIALGHGDGVKAHMRRADRV